ncbi:MAG: TonB-dependent receptor [Muribaculaceae bacterium]|nr:TonB-dependent receptor [Muribaculaceae bacterium]
MKQDLFRQMRTSGILKGGLCLALACGAGVVSAYAVEPPAALAAPQKGATHKLTGTVYDQNNEPVIGASVMVKGTTIGTATDIDGKFTLNVPAKGTLIVSYVGYVAQEIALNGQTELRVDLKEDTASLDELVVVGYGVQKKATLTGSVSSVGGEDIKKVSAANLSNTLAGKTAGIIANTRSGEPGEDSAEITIRGKGTLGSTGPLIVVDGVADRSFSRLNPEDIESISVLKDASAAIYGARAANGVILVTTKRGKEGKVKVNYNGSYSWAQPTRIPKMLNSYQYATYRNEYDADSRHDSPGLTFGQDALDHYQNHDDLDRFPDTDWWGATAKKWAGRTQHSVSVSGGNEKVSFYSSFQYMWQDALYRKSAQDYSQFQITSNVDARISKALSFSLDILGRQEKRNRGVFSTEDLFGKLLTMFPGAAPYYSNGLPRVGYDGITNNSTVMVTDAPGYNRYKYHILNLKPKVRVDLDVITKGLYAEAYAALDFQFNYGKQLNRPYDLYALENGEYVNKRDMTGQISVSDWSDNSLNSTWNVRLGYNREFNELHDINAFVAYEENRYSSHSLSGYRTNFLSDLLPDLFAGSDVPDDKDNNGYSNVTTRRNVFGRINYTYASKYLAEVTMRYDGSMNFAKKHRWGFFPAFSLGWVISSESFFERAAQTVNFLKLKFSWGKMGNDNIAPYQYLAQYKYGRNPDDGSGIYFGTGEDAKLNKGFYLERVANALVTWESSRMINAGFSANFLNNKFGLDFDWFHSVRNDILCYRNASVPYFSGMKLPAENLGKVTNSGVEIVANYRDHAGDFSWSVTGNFTYARNKVNFIDEAADTKPWQRQEGSPIDGMTLYNAIGIYQNWDQVNSTPHIEGAAPGDLIYVDTDGNGTITWDDAVRYDYSPTPRIIYGLTLTGEWKGIDLSVFFQGQGQAKQLVQPTMNMATDFYEGRWREGNTEQENLNARWPKAFMGQTYGDQWNGVASTWWLRSANFLRLKSLEIGYTLPRKWWGNSGIDNIRIYFNGSNLFTIDNYKVADPEVDNAILSYPLQRSLTFGAGITF